MSANNKQIISASNVQKLYEDFCVLKDIKLSIQEGEKIGLVGPNGIGKTTLLKILAGIDQPTGGEVFHAKDITIGYIPQKFDDFFDVSVEKFLQVKQNEAATIFAKLDLSTNLLTRLIKDLSGGERTKVGLARIMLAPQDLLLLDEPTNNLDIDALEVLEKFIEESDKTFVIISHDREFLNQVIGRVFEIDEYTRELHIYEGNYSSYLEERIKRVEKQWGEYADHIDEKKHLEKVIDDKKRHVERIEKEPPRDNDKFLRNFKIEHGQRSLHKLAKHLQTRLADMEDVDKPKHKLLVNLEFEIDQRSGDRVFSLKNVIKRLPEFTIGPIDLDIQYGEKVLITGKNGAGKTTLLKMIIRELVPDEGEIIVGTNLNIGYLPQHEDFLPDNSVVDEFLRHVEIEEGLARRSLSRFGLSADDAYKKIKDISSGERSRLILAILMSKKANCLILDEPSNHLDFEILEALEGALKEYDGTLIVVSHDRYFIEQISFDRKINISKGQI